MSHKIIQGDCLEVMRGFPDNHFSAIVSDPPYGLGFMGKKWDAGLPCDKTWREALRVLKPSGHLLAFGGTRTYHRLTCSIEDAGFEIRDCLLWLYGSGFPKSHNHFGLEGYGTALKPAYEPCIMAMKPCDGTFAQNVEKWGFGGINIDRCKIPTQETWKIGNRGTPSSTNTTPCNSKGTHGRWPANVLLDEESAAQLDDQSGLNSSRFFYCVKASSKERNQGCEQLDEKSGGGMKATVHGDTRTGHVTKHKNNHPTVKPQALMRYLITLVAPPKDALILDPFAGTGSTIIAAKQLGISAIGIEKEHEYCKIAEARLSATSISEKINQLDLFNDN